MIISVIKHLFILLVNSDAHIILYITLLRIFSLEIFIVTFIKDLIFLIPSVFIWFFWIVLFNFLSWEIIFIFLLKTFFNIICYQVAYFLSIMMLWIITL